MSGADAAALKQAVADGKAEGASDEVKKGRQGR